MVALKDYVDYNITKHLFFIFSKQFKVLNQNELMDNITLINYHKVLIEKNPHLAAYAYQFAFESVYSKRFVSQQDLEVSFNNRFTVLDPYGLNDLQCSFADVNTAFSINHLQKNTNFNTCSFSILSTPIEYHTTRYYDIQSRLPSINKNRLLTGNTNPDMTIEGVPYDLKHWSINRSTKLNHIYPLSYDQFEFSVENHFKNVLQELKSSIKLNESLQNLKFFKKSAKYLENLIQDKKTVWIEKNNLWHIYIKNHLAIMPPNFSTPILIRLTDAPYKYKTPKFIAEKIQVSNDVLNNPVKARNAIAGITHLFGMSTVEKASKATFGAIKVEKPCDDYSFSNDVD